MQCCLVLFLVRREVVWVAGIVVESPVEQYLLFVHEEEEGVLSEQDRDAMQRSTGAPQGPYSGPSLCKPSVHCPDPLLTCMQFLHVPWTWWHSFYCSFFQSHTSSDSVYFQGWL